MSEGVGCLFCGDKGYSQIVHFGDRRVKEFCDFCRGSEANSEKVRKLHSAILKMLWNEIQAYEESGYRDCADAIRDARNDIEHKINMFYS